jgi:hypothetical protein
MDEQGKKVNKKEVGKTHLAECMPLELANGKIEITVANKIKSFSSTLTSPKNLTCMISVVFSH